MTIGDAFDDSSTSSPPESNVADATVPASSTNVGNVETSKKPSFLRPKWAVNKPGMVEVPTSNDYNNWSVDHYGKSAQSMDLVWCVR